MGRKIIKKKFQKSVDGKGKVRIFALAITDGRGAGQERLVAKFFEAMSQA